MATTPAGVAWYCAEVRRGRCPKKPGRRNTGKTPVIRRLPSDRVQGEGGVTRGSPLRREPMKCDRWPGPKFMRPAPGQRLRTVEHDDLVMTVARAVWFGRAGCWRGQRKELPGAGLSTANQPKKKEQTPQYRAGLAPRGPSC